MRIAGECKTEEMAQRFSDYLLTLKITNEVKAQSGGWAVWVHAEDDVERASREFDAFAKEPQAARYEVKTRADAIRREMDTEAPEEPRAPALDLPWFRSVARASTPLTITLIAISIGTMILTDQGQSDIARRYLLCDPLRLLHGEIWRLITPAFVHFTFLHILFNMLWLEHLGSLIERRKGTLFLLVMLVVLACISNLCQALMRGPDFGGMSGVVYGLFGYVWMKSRYEPFEGLLLDQMTVILMLGWFLLGMTSRIGPVANWAHAAGLVAGIVFGAAPTALKQLKKK